jgi:hypothetical protein
VNSFEVAIIRIAIKKHKPIPISHLIEGFPNNSEDFVLEAISNLFNLGYISYPYSEKNHITYNRERRKEILRIIDPLPQLQVQRQELSAAEVDDNLETLLKKRKDDNRRYHYYTFAKYRGVGRFALVMWVLFFGIVSIFGSAVSTEDVYQNFKVLDNYHIHKINYLIESYGIGMSDNAGKNHGLYYSPYFKIGEFSNSNDFLHIPYCV